MNDLYIHTASGAIYRPGQIVVGIQTHAGMTAAAWADLGCVPYVEPPVEPQPEVDYLAVRANELWLAPSCKEAVQGVLLAVTAIASLGVDITDWSFQGVSAAAKASIAGADIQRTLTLTIAALDLRTAWDRIVYHCGDMKTADDLWPYFYVLAMS